MEYFDIFKKFDDYFFSNGGNVLYINSFNKNENSYDIFVNVAGLQKENISVEVEENSKGTIFNISVKENTKNVFEKECEPERLTFTLRNKVELEKITVEVKEGLMKINVPILSNSKKILIS